MYCFCYQIQLNLQQACRGAGGKVYVYILYITSAGYHETAYKYNGQPRLHYIIAFHSDAFIQSDLEEIKPCYNQVQLNQR